jgi:hypothetical protein
MQYQELKLYRPLVTNRLTQKFGENRVCVNDRGVVTGKRGNVCPAGTRDFYRSLGMAGHNGLDFGGITGEHVFKCGTFDGWMKSETDRMGGIGVDVVSNERLFFPGEPPAAIRDKVERHTQNGRVGFLSFVKELHWHCLSVVGHDGKQVKLGQVVALAGSTGASTATHDHLGLKFVDERGVRLDRTPDWTGAFDPLPYMDVDTDAKTAAEWLRTPPPPLSPEETERVRQQLSLAQRALLALLELRRK